MIPRKLNNRDDYQFDLQGDAPSIALNDSGDVLTCNVTKYVPLSSASTSSILPPIVSNGINLILESECPELASSFQRAHLEFVLSYNADFVKDGAQEDDVLYRFESVDPDGWFVETDSIYDMPGSGYTSTYVTYRYRVKYVATGLTLDLSRPVYFYRRARYVVLTLGMLYLTDTYSDYYGKLIDIRESYFSNTGTSQINQIAVPLLPSISDYWSDPWPSDKNVHYEVYIGKYGNYSEYSSTGEWEIYKDSSSDPSGFYYFNGLSVVGFGSNGIPSSNEWNKVVFVTDELDSEKALFAVYRAKWDGGQTDWISQSLRLVDYVSNDLSKTFYPTSEITVRANEFSGRYHAHVIVGTDPNLADYFDEDDTDDFTKLLTSFPGLLEYSYSGNVTDVNRFFYYSGGSVKNEAVNGFDNTIDNVIVYKSSQNYTDDNKVYVFWRFEYDTPISSSSMSLSSESSSSDSSSSLSSDMSSSSSSASADLIGWYQKESHYGDDLTLFKYNDDWTAVGQEVINYVNLDLYTLDTTNSYIYFSESDESGLSYFVKIQYDGTVISRTLCELPPPFLQPFAVCASRTSNNFYCCAAFYVCKNDSSGSLVSYISLPPTINILGLDVQIFDSTEYLYAFDEHGYVYKIDTSSFSISDSSILPISDVRSGKYYDGYWYVTNNSDNSVRKYSNSIDDLPYSEVDSFSITNWSSLRISRRYH